MSLQSVTRPPLAGSYWLGTDDVPSGLPLPVSLAPRASTGIRGLVRPSETAFAPHPVPMGALRRVTTAACRAAVQGLRILLEWPQRDRERRQLMSLDDRVLRDIGLTRRDIQRL